MHVRLLLFSRIPVTWALIFASVMAIAQLFLHTNPQYVILNFAYVILWVSAFNEAGGFTRPSGAYIFWFGLLTVLSGSTLKVLLGEAPDTNSWVPVSTMMVYTVAMAMLYLAAITTRHLMRGTGSIAERLTQSHRFSYHDAGLGALMMSVLLIFAVIVLPGGSGSLGALLQRINLLPYLAIILSTIDAVQRSGGRRSTSWLVWVSAGLAFWDGLIGFSKEGMFGAIVCYLMGLAFTQFRIRWVTGLTLAAIVTFVVMVLVPICQIGRAEGRDLPVSGRFQLIVDMAENIHVYRDIADSQETDQRANGQSYFSHNVGTMGERLTMWNVDDLLISYTLHGNYIGYDWVWWNFYNWLPHVIAPDKEKAMPKNAGGNYYARQVGMITPDDEGTGISFGIPAELFHLGGWQGVWLMLPALWVVFFLSIELLMGDMRRTPWGMFYGMYFAHMAPESGIPGLIYVIWYMNIAMLACIVICVYVAPLAGQLVSGSGRAVNPLPREKERPLHA